MPDRYGEDPALDVPDLVWSAEQRRLHAAYAISQCGLCDEEGRRPDLTRCDHKDYRATAARGLARVREALSSNHTKVAGSGAQESAQTAKGGHSA